MQNFIKLQNILSDPKRTFQDFKTQLINSEITQFTYLCLLLNISATTKRVNFSFQSYLDLLTNFKKEPGYRSACINYTGYKDKISILMNACEKSLTSTVALLIAHPDLKLHAIDPNELNAGFYAIKNPDQNQGLKILELLHESSPQMIDTVTNNGYTPLFLSVEKFRLKIVEFLLKNHADPNQKLVNSGNTAMHQLIKISSKYSLEEVKKMVELFLRYDFDLNVKNNQGKTVQEYAFDLRFNISEIIKQILYKKPSSQFGFFSEDGQTDVNSSKIGTTKVGDIFTTYNYSQIQRSQCNYQIDNMSVGNKSLLSQEVNYFRHQDQRQLSLDMNANQSQKNDHNQIDQNEIYEFQKKFECYSHSDSPNSDFQVTLHQSNLNQTVTDSSQSSQDEEGEFLAINLIDYQKIQNQIIEFDQISRQAYILAWREIQPFFIKLKDVTESLGLSIEIIGSFATGLWTHHSDIDIALVTQTQSYVDFQRILDKVYGKIKGRMYPMGIKQISYNKASKIPSIKIDMDPYLFSSRKIDIMIFHKKNMGITYANFIQQTLNCYNFIRPLFFFLKRVCEQFGLHDPFNGGMKSYSIFLMIHSMIISLELTNLAEILLRISYYFGFYHVYDYEIQCYANNNNEQIEYVPVLRLNIKDPLNNKNNMGGKNTNVPRLKNMFRTIYYGLHKKIIHGTNLQHILQMAHIVLQNQQI